MKMSSAVSPLDKKVSAAAKLLSDAAWKTIRSTMSTKEISEQRRKAGKLGADARWSLK